MRGNPRVVLASASPRRAEILTTLGIPFVVHPAHIDEAYLPGERPRDHVLRLAREKAAAVEGEYPGTLVIAGDTVVVLGDRVLGKPADGAEALAMLMALSGKPHAVLTGLALALPDGRVLGDVQATEVRFRPFDEALARAYVETGEPMDKAGAYGIQGKGAALVAGFSGDYFNVVGFPVPLFLSLLEEAGWEFRFSAPTPPGGEGEAHG